MQALNAKIGKNNELVERHERMMSPVKAMSDENKQLAAQFREACEYRPVAQALTSNAQRSDSACSSATGTKDVEPGSKQPSPRCEPMTTRLPSP